MERTIDKTVPKTAIRLKLVTRQGRPVAGAGCGMFVIWDDIEGKKVTQAICVRQGKQTPSGKTGSLTVREEQVFYAGAPPDRAVPLYIAHKRRKPGALISLCRRELGTTRTVQLRPFCRVYGKLGSKELDTLGKALSWTNTYVYWNKLRQARYSTTKQKFEFLLPPGEYRLEAYGTDTYSVEEKIRKQVWGGRKIPFPVALDGGGKTRVPGSKRRARGATTAAYGINAFPTSLLIDRNGILVERLAVRNIEIAGKQIESVLG